MINFSNIILEKMAIHKVGNKSKAEKNFFSEVLYKPSASNEDKLLKYFLSPFKKVEETYQFNAPENDTNAMFNLSKSFFATKENFLEISQRPFDCLYYYLLNEFRVTFTINRSIKILKLVKFSSFTFRNYCTEKKWWKQLAFSNASAKTNSCKSIILMTSCY